MSHDWKQELITKLQLSAGIFGAYFIIFEVINLHSQAILTKLALFLKKKMINYIILSNKGRKTISVTRDNMEI